MLSLQQLGVLWIKHVVNAPERVYTSDYLITGFNQLQLTILSNQLIFKKSLIIFNKYQWS